MTNSNDNPYRPPSDDPSLASAEAVPAELVPDGCWRWRQLLIVRQSGAVLPRACVRSNEEVQLFDYPLTAMSLIGLWLCFFAFFVPAIGWIILGLLVSVKQLGLVVNFKLPITRGRAALLVIFELTFYFVLIGANSLTAFGIYYASYSLILLGAGLSLAAYACFWASDRLYLQTQLVGADYIIIQGVHPGFLDRLPEFPDITDERLFTVS